MSPVTCLRACKRRPLWHSFGEAVQGLALTTLCEGVGDNHLAFDTSGSGGSVISTNRTKGRDEMSPTTSASSSPAKSSA